MRAPTGRSTLSGALAPRRFPIYSDNGAADQMWEADLQSQRVRVNGLRDTLCAACGSDHATEDHATEVR